MFRVTKEFRWEANHNLPHHDGQCQNEHGHSYVIEVTVEGPRLELTLAHPKEGMLIDFKDLSDIVNEIIEAFDHNGSLNKTLNHLQKALVMAPTVSTAENVAYTLYQAITHTLQSVRTELQCHSVKVHETVKTTAEYIHDDCPIYHTE